MSEDVSEDFVEPEPEETPSCLGDYAAGSETCDWCEWSASCEVESQSEEENRQKLSKKMKEPTK